LQAARDNQMRDLGRSRILASPLCIIVTYQT
jgi:hypothetical protein